MLRTTCYTFLGTLLTTSGLVSPIPPFFMKLPGLSFVLFWILFSSFLQMMWAQWDQPVAYCPAHPPELVNSFTTLSPLIFVNTPPYRPWPFTFDRTSPPGNLSYSQPYLVLGQFTHFDLYFHWSKKNFSQ